MSACTSRLLKSTLAAGLAAITVLTGLPATMAADHGDGPFASVKRSGDLNDLYVFLDPNDNSRVVVILTAVGFTVPGEAVNFSVFDHELVFEFQFETTGNARPDRLIQVRFSPKGDSGATPQIATITLPNGRRFRAPTTPSNLTAPRPRPTITTGRNGIQFFAGSADDPFFFDIPGFNRFVGSVLDGPPPIPPSLIAVATPSRATTPWRSRSPSPVAFSVTSETTSSA